jgi:AcrR family transcriptional regulator
LARTQEQRKAETRAGLLAAAADQFDRKGFHAVSAEAVADAADRTTGALYSHFGNKEGLLFALLEDWKEATADAIVAHVPDPGDLDGIISATWDLLTSAPDEPGGQWLLLEMELWLHGARDDSIGAQLAERYAHIRADFAKGLVDWSTAADQSLPAPAEQLSAVGLSLLLGGALLHRLEPASIPPSWVVDAVRALVGQPAATTTRSKP